MATTDEDMLDLLNSKIQFTTPEGEYEGVVTLVCPVSKKMIVKKIIFLPKKLNMGTLTFKFHEVLNHIIISRPQSGYHDFKDQNSNSFSYIPTRGRDICIVGDADELSEIDEAENLIFSDELLKEEEYILNLPPFLLGKIPNDSIIVDQIDEEFHLAINHIQLQVSIGISLEGPKLDRHGILSWLSISTAYCTFLFDIKNLGQEGLNQGLKSILENKKIEKIFHDCREPSDCLYHKFGVKLINVFDTQVADLLVTMQQSKDIKLTKHASPLNSCLRTFLEIPEDYLHRSKAFKSYNETVLYYNLRPLGRHQRNLMIKNVIYLRLLKSQLDIALLTPYRRAVEVYLQSLQAFSDRELLLRPNVKEEVPQELLMEGIHVVRFMEFVKVSPIISSGPPYRKLKNPVENYITSCDQYKLASDESSKINLLHCSSSNNSESAVNIHRKKYVDIIKENENQYSLDRMANSDDDTLSNSIADDLEYSEMTYRLNDIYLKENQSHSPTDNMMSPIKISYSLRDSSTKGIQSNVSPRLKKGSCNGVHSLTNRNNFNLKDENNDAITNIAAAGSNEQEIIESSESMSSTSDTSVEDDPWATLRKQAIDSFSGEYETSKIKFIPAGLWQEG